ncbi:MAG TPA: MOSC domain-containing protein [Chloroflexota bacterium]|jgi:MOSC domain-containing protein YiiM
MDGQLVSVNVGRPRTVPWNGSTVTTSIWKAPVGGRIAVRGVNVEGDDQADRSVHGGSDKAVYAYGVQDYRWWSAELGRELEPGSFGENLTIDGFDVSDALIGERWHIGDVVFEVSQPRIPCYKLGIRHSDAEFPRRFATAERPGAYLRIIHPGSVATGDTVTVLSRPAHGLTARLVSRAYHTDRSLVPRLLEVPELTASWRAWAAKILQHA